MTRFAALAPLALLAACASHPAPRPADVAREQAAGQFTCQREDVTAQPVGGHAVQVSGCGKTATWSCAEDEARDGHSCRRVTAISSGGDAPRSSARAKTTPDPKASAEGEPFPRDDARTALRAAEAGLRSCRDGDAPRTLSVSLRFEPSGKVSKVDVVPADGPAASCVRTRLSEVSVMPFGGEPVTVQVPVHL